MKPDNAFLLDHLFGLDNLLLMFGGIFAFDTRTQFSTRKVGSKAFAVHFEALGFFADTLASWFGFLFWRFRNGILALIIRLIGGAVIVLTLSVRILGLHVSVIWMVLMLLRAVIKVKILGVGVWFWVGEVEWVGNIIRPVTQKVADFAVIEELILGERDGFGIDVLDIDEIVGLGGRLVVGHGLERRPMWERGEVEDDKWFFNKKYNLDWLFLGKGKCFIYVEIINCKVRI